MAKKHECTGIISSAKYECSPAVNTNEPKQLRVKGKKAYFVYDNDLEVYQGEIISHTDNEILIENDEAILKITVE